MYICLLSLLLTYFDLNGLYTHTHLCNYITCINTSKNITETIIPDLFSHNRTILCRCAGKKQQIIDIIIIFTLRKNPLTNFQPEKVIFSRKSAKLVIMSNNDESYWEPTVEVVED